MKNNIGIAVDDRRVLKGATTSQSIIVKDKYARYKTPELTIKTPKIKTEIKNAEISTTGIYGLIGLSGMFIWSNSTSALCWHNLFLPIFKSNNNA